MGRQEEGSGVSVFCSPFSQKNLLGEGTFKLQCRRGLVRGTVTEADRDHWLVQDALEIIGHSEPKPVKGVVVRDPDTQPIQSLCHMLLCPAATLQHLTWAALIDGAIMSCQFPPKPHVCLSMAVLCNSAGLLAIQADISVCCLWFTAPDSLLTPCAVLCTSAGLWQTFQFVARGSQLQTVYQPPGIAVQLQSDTTAHMKELQGTRITIAGLTRLLVLLTLATV